MKKATLTGGRSLTKSSQKAALAGGFSPYGGRGPTGPGPHPVPGRGLYPARRLWVARPPFRGHRPSPAISAQGLVAAQSLVGALAGRAAQALQAVAAAARAPGPSARALPAPVPVFGNPPAVAAPSFLAFPAVPVVKVPTAFALPALDADAPRGAWARSGSYPCAAAVADRLSDSGHPCTCADRQAKVHAVGHGCGPSGPSRADALARGGPSAGPSAAAGWAPSA